jgi:hypothetical protein
LEGEAAAVSAATGAGEHRQTDSNSKQQQCVRMYFFRSILNYSQNGDHPQEDLATFGY